MCSLSLRCVYVPGPRLPQHPPVGGGGGGRQNFKLYFITQQPRDIWIFESHPTEHSITTAALGWSVIHRIVTQQTTNRITHTATTRTPLHKVKKRLCVCLLSLCCSTSGINSRLQNTVLGGTPELDPTTDVCCSP